MEGVTGSVMFSYEISILNISVDGIAFRTTKRLQIGKTYLLKLPYGDGDIPIRGKVVWCNLSGTARTPEGDSAPVYTLGMRFEPHQEDRIQQLKRLVEKHRKEEAVLRAIRVGITLAPGTDREITLDSLYPVTHLSPTDVIVEVDTPLALDQRSQLEIHLPDKTIVYPMARTLSSEAAGPSRHRIHMEFIQITDKDERAIRDVLLTISDI